VANAPKVSMATYEAMLEIYEAQNAIGIARTAGADKYAASTLAKAQALLGEAQRLQVNKSANNVVVQDAREAAETAEDARVIAERRQQDEKVAAAQQTAARAEATQAQTLAELQAAKAEAEAARAQAEAERAALQRAEADAAAARQQAEQAAASARAAVQAAPPADPAAERTELRRQLFEQLSGILPTLDTPRGLVVTVADGSFDGSEVSEAASTQVAQLAGMVKAHPGLRADVEGFADGADGQGTSYARAQAVGAILLSQGLSADAITARGLGDSRPLVANTSAANRRENRRVEVVISGQPIGNLASWDRTYGLVPSTQGKR